VYPLKHTNKQMGRCPFQYTQETNTVGRCPFKHTHKTNLLKETKPSTFLLDERNMEHFLHRNARTIMNGYGMEGYMESYTLVLEKTKKTLAAILTVFLFHDSS
jgi:hypothetical protein